MLKSYDKFVKLTMQELSETSTDFSRIKKRVSGLLQLPIPSNADLREIYEKLVMQKKSNANQFLKNSSSAKKFALAPE